MLYTKLVELTAGLVKPRTLIWNGSRMNAPDTPASEVKADTTSATSGGRNIQVFTPDTGKNTERNSMASNYSIKTDREKLQSYQTGPRRIQGCLGGFPRCNPCKIKISV